VIVQPRLTAGTARTSSQAAAPDLLVRVVGLGTLLGPETTRAVWCVGFLDRDHSAFCRVQTVLVVGIGVLVVAGVSGWCLRIA
jgi:hypothetical protein